MCNINIDYPEIMALIVVIIGSITDLRTSKIPNKLTFPAAGIGIITSAVYTAQTAEGDLLVKIATGAINGILGWLAGVFIMSITKMFMPRFGHGDTKLMAAVGAFIGPGPVFIAYIYYCLVFGFFALTRLALAFPWRDFITVSATHGDIKSVLLNSEKFNHVRKAPLPVGPFIAIGTALAIFLKDATLTFLNYK